MSPASASSSSLRNISTPVTTGLLRRADTDDLDLVIDMADATLDAARGDGATTGDGEDVLDGHEERLVGLAGGSRDVLVDSVHELPDGILIALVALRGP